MSGYKDLFGTSLTKAVDPDEIEAWLKKHPEVKTKRSRISYILNGASLDTISANQISEIGSVHVGEATEANKCVDNVVNEFADMKNSLEPAEKLIVEALHLIEGGTKGKGLRGFLGSFKAQRDPSEIREEVKDKISDAVNQFDVKIPIRVEPFIEGLNDAKYYLVKISEGLDNTINALNFLIDGLEDPLLKDLALRRKEMFAKSIQLMGINMGQLDSMLKICEQKKGFVEELKMTVIPIIESVMRSSLISGNTDLSQISEALKKIL